MYRNMGNHCWITGVAVVFLLSITFCSGDQTAESILSESIVSTVTGEDFRTRYTAYLQRTGIQDNMEVRRSILQQLHHEELLLAAYDSSAAEHSGIQKRVRVAQDDFLVDAFAHDILRPGISVSEDEIHQRFAAESRYYHLRQVFAVNHQEAERERKSLLAGVPFQTVSQNIASPSLLDQSFNDLGYVQGKELKPNILRAVRNLTPGEYSRPIRVPTGYTIIQVRDVKSHPLPTETQFAQERTPVIDRIREEKLRTAATAYVNSYLTTLQLEWNGEAVRSLLHYLVLYPFPGGNSELMERMRLHGLSPGTVLATGEKGHFLIADFLEWADRTPHAIPEVFTSEHDLQEFIQGLIARRHLVVQAEEHGLNKTHEYESYTDRLLRKYQLEKITDQVLDTLRIPDRELEQFFVETRSEFNQTARINVREIIVRDRDLALQLHDRIARGESMATLAAEYTERLAVRESGGELGFGTQADYGRFWPHIYDAPIDSVIGPYAHSNYFVLFSVIERQPAEPAEFHQVKSRVKSFYLQTYRRQLMEKCAQTLDKKFKGTILWTKLAEVQIQQVNQGDIL